MDQSRQSTVVQLPRTPTRRGATASLTLVQRVNLSPRVPGLLAWEGTYFKPGAFISYERLFETVPPDGTPLVLECTEAEARQGARRRWRLMLILWKWDEPAGEFIELARLADACSYEFLELRRIAARALGQALPEDEAIAHSAERIRSYLDREIEQSGERRAAVLEHVLHELIGRIVAVNGCLNLRPQFGSFAGRSVANG